MSQREILASFVCEALTAGKSRGDIETALNNAGWSKGEVQEALDAYADMEFVPPVPRPRIIVSARDFFIYALMFAALAAASFYLISLAHHLIEWAFEDRVNRWDMRNMRWAMAGLIVSGPIYAWLNLREIKRLRADPGLYRSAIRKWTTYVTLLIAALVFLGNLIAVIYGFLDGELTMTFFLKVLAVAVVSGSVFLYYLRETEGASA